MKFRYSVFALTCALTMTCSASAQVFTGTLKKIKETGSITLGVRESSIPMAYLDDKQQPVGYAVDICKKIVDVIKVQLAIPELKVVYQPANSSNRIALVTNGTMDLECASTSNLVDRQKLVAFSVTHFVSNIRAMVRADSPYTNLSSLNGKPIALITGMTAIPMLQKYSADNKVTFDRAYGKDVAEAFLLFQTRRAEAFVFDDVLLASMAANTGDAKAFKILDDTLRSEPNALMLRKDDPAFKKVVDDTILGLIKSGEIEKIYGKWFLQPIPPKNINLNFPMSKELKESFARPNDAGV
jgi:glutamate/aspartate transport system substrate-binding protein